MTVQIELISDVVCPWCFIGKRRLEQALARLREMPAAPDVNVAWLPFQLNPDLPETGIDRADYLRRKFGHAAPQIYARVAGAGRSVGIAFAFDAIARQPNTVAAHQLIALAGSAGRQDQMVETLFRAYFLEGADLTQRATLIALAQRSGIDPARAAACLDDPLQRQAVLDAERDGRELGVEGVPLFLFNRRLAVSGAHEPQVLLGAIEQAARDATEVT
ncbi:MAG TPA: DsbA family oxidoreductase [Burkholderiales bacterium]|jgi:predicted DsbA family dithiol-disulfide isomerase